jgi:hypothetical protein
MVVVLRGRHATFCNQPWAACTDEGGPGRHQLAAFVDLVGAIVGAGNFGAELMR